MTDINESNKHALTHMLQGVANMLGDAGFLPTPSKVTTLPSLTEEERIAYEQCKNEHFHPANLRTHTAWQLVEAAFAAGAAYQRGKA